MRDHLISGLDLGSSTLRLVVAQKSKDSQRIEILGSAITPVAGIRRGVITDIQEVIKGIKTVLAEGERNCGREIKSLYLNIGGSHIATIRSRGVVAVSRADGEISPEDIDRVIGAAQAISLPQNREIIHIVPQEFIIDGERGIKDPLGMHGIRLEVETLIIHSFSPFLKNFYKCFEELELKIEAIVISPLAVSRAVLSRRQKELGVLVLDIGAGTTGFAIFEEGDLLHIGILPIGSSHITNDIAIFLRTSIDIAERIKLEYGCAISSEIDKKERIEFSRVGGEEGDFSRREVAEIIEARLSEIFDLVSKELNKIGKANLLPAGVVITGGGAKLPFIVDLAKKSLRLPCQIGFPLETEFEGIIDRVNDPSFALVCGLLLWGKDELEEGVKKSLTKTGFFGKLKRIFKPFLP